MVICIFESSSIPILVLVTFAVFLIITVSGVAVLKIRKKDE